MKETYFKKIVNILWKSQWKIITNETIKTKLTNLLDTEYSDGKMYKIVYHLKLKGHIINLKKNLFYISSPDKTYTEEELSELTYREVLKKHCQDLIGNKRYIWGLKALEIALLSYSIPDEILLVTSQKQATDTIIFDKKALLKTYTSKEKNLFPIFSKYTQKITIGKHQFNIALPELAILETLYNTAPLQKSYAEELIKKRLRKNKKYLNLELLTTLLKTNKHNSSINRLALLLSPIDINLSQEIKNLIKKHGHLLY